MINTDNHNKQQEILMKVVACLCDKGIGLNDNAD